MISCSFTINHSLDWTMNATETRIHLTISIKDTKNERNVTSEFWRRHTARINWNNTMNCKNVYILYTYTLTHRTRRWGQQVVPLTKSSSSRRVKTIPRRWFIKKKKKQLACARVRKIEKEGKINNEKTQTTRVSLPPWCVGSSTKQFGSIRLRLR